MRRMRQILEDQRGVSILYGLLFLLVAFMVSAVILSASLTAVERVHNDEVRQQDSLTLSSAGNFVRGCLEKDTKCTFDLTTDIATGETAVSNVNVTGPLQGVLTRAMNEATGATAITGPRDSSGSFDIEVDARVDALDDATVVVDYVLRKDQGGDDSDPYRIEAELSLQGGNQRMFLIARCGSPKSRDKSATDGVKVTEETVEWGDVTLSTWDGRTNQ